jgi:hypothetical protein
MNNQEAIKNCEPESDRIQLRFTESLWLLYRIYYKEARTAIGTLGNADERWSSLGPGKQQQSW